MKIFPDGIVLVALPIIAALILVAVFIPGTIYPAPQNRVLGENGTVPEPSPLPPFPYSEERIADMIHIKVNEYRNQNNITSVQWDDGLAQLAKSHSIDMNVNNYFEHDGPDGTVLERSISAGFEICGDREASMIAIEYEQANKDFAIQQDIHNEKVADLNTLSNSYTVKQKQYEQDKLYQSKFNQNDQISYLRLQKQSQELNQEYENLNRVESNLRQEDQTLSLLHRELETKRAVVDQYVLETRLFDGVSENIMLGYTYSTMIEDPSGIIFEWMTEEEISQRVLDGWIGSPHHREIMIGQFFQSEGIGVSIDHINNKILVTQDFC